MFDTPTKSHTHSYWAEPAQIPSDLDTPTTMIDNTIPSCDYDTPSTQHTHNLSP